MFHYYNRNLRKYHKGMFSFLLPQYKIDMKGNINIYGIVQCSSAKQQPLLLDNKNIKRIVRDSRVGYRYDHRSCHIKNVKMVHVNSLPSALHKRQINRTFYCTHKAQKLSNKARKLKIFVQFASSFCNNSVFCLF